MHDLRGDIMKRTGFTMLGNSKGTACANWAEADGVAGGCGQSAHVSAPPFGVSRLRARGSRPIGAAFSLAATMLALSLALALAFALTGCAGSNEASSSGAEQSSAQEATSSSASSSVAGTSSSAASASAESAEDEQTDGEDEGEEYIDPDDDGSADDDGSNPEPKVVDEAIADITPVVVADDGTCTITVTGRGTDTTGDPCYRLVFTYKTGSVLYLTAEDEFDVNGTAITAGVDEVAEPGQSVEALLFFPARELNGGADKLVNVSGTLNVEIDDTYEPVADYPFHME